MQGRFSQVQLFATLQTVASQASLSGSGGSPDKNTGAYWPMLMAIPFSVQSVTQSCRTLCNSMSHSTPGLPVHHQLLESTQTHVHWVSDAIQPSHPLSSPLEHYISCCPRRQPPWVPGAGRTPETHTVASPPHLALTGAKPSPPGQPQERTPVDDPHAEVEIKPQLKPRGSVAKEEDPKPSRQLYKLQIKSTQSTRQTLCL